MKPSWFIVLLVCWIWNGVSGFPPGCIVKDERPRGAGSKAAVAADKRVMCKDLELTGVVSSLMLPNRTVSLNLNNNKISELRNGSFFGFDFLERLDFKNNTLSYIEPGAFEGLLSLKRLDLSDNKLGCLNREMFKGLQSLTKLNLTGNLFSSLTQDTFDNLISLKNLEFQTDYLLCDCNMHWLPHWVKEKNITIRETRCAYPKSLQEQLLADVKLELLTCDAPLELPSFYMTPSHRQVVFEGDSLPFQCMASYIDQDMQVLWYQDGKMVETNESQGIFVEKSMVHNCSLIASALTISNIQAGSTGNWECRIRTRRGNNTRTVDIVVLQSSAQYCSPEKVVNNKGEFKWPRTLAGITAYVQCTRYSAGSGIYPGGSADDRRAWRKCDRGGFWVEEDYSQCQYSSDVTRVLYMFNQMPLNVTNAVATARQLLAYTVEAANFSDKMDIIFMAEMIEKFGKFPEKYKELDDVMVDIASNIMLADEQVLRMAQREARACSRIVQWLQRIASYRLASGALVYSSYSPNIAVEAYVIKAAGFTGMTCTVFQKVVPGDRINLPDFGRRDVDGNLDKQLSLKCNVTNTLTSLVLRNTVKEATIHLPASLFSQHASQGAVEENSYRLQLIAFRNGKLFPATGNSSNLADCGKRRTVATPVILTKIDGLTVENLSTPINLTLRRIAHGIDAVAAQWDFDILNGQGGWKLNGCHIVASDENVTTIQCNSISNYAVLLDLTRPEFSHSAELLHPVVYAASVVLLLCLLIILVSYIYHHSVIRISRKSWHMLVNVCLHIFLTCMVFVGGIAQSKNTTVCQAVGILLHYSSLATLLWVGVTARNVYKQVTRKSKRCQDPDEPPPPPRPMLRFYLIGGGIPIIVCGITAAANIKNYGSRLNAPYCWMAWEPSLGAFFGPAGFILFINSMYFLSIFVQLKQHPERKYELKEAVEEQQRLATSEHGELNHHGSASISQANCSVVSASTLENEHTFYVQLLGASLTLFLYVFVWIFGALAVALYYPLDLVFSCLFGVTCLGFGTFLVMHHCVNREDVRRDWIIACCPGRSTYSMQVSIQPADVSRTNGDASKCASSSAESSCTNRSASSLKQSSQGCKLTNLHIAAAQCYTNILPLSTATQFDNSLTEHSLENDAKMHISPLDVHFRSNGNSVKQHKNRTRANRASRLTVLREYAYDVPTSVEGSEQNGISKSRPSNHEGHSRSRRAYLAYRERHFNQCQQQDSSDASSTLPRYSRNIDRAGNIDSKDCLRQPDTVELEGQQKSYGVNLVTQHGLLKGSGQETPLVSADSSGNIRTGLWKHETTV